MIQKRDILKMVKAIHRKSQGQRNRRLIHPAREWSLGLIFMAVLFIAGLIYAVYTYNTYNNIENRLTEPELQTVRYQAAQVERALELYDARQERLMGLPLAQPVVETIAASSTDTITSSETATTSVQTNDQEADEVVTQETEAQERAGESQPEPSGEAGLTSS